MMVRGNVIASASMLAVLWLGSVQSASADAILVHQRATAPGGAASQQSPNTTYLPADDFVLETRAFINGVSWQGAFSDVQPSDITQFEVAFWNDIDGFPGVPLQSFTFPGNAGQTLVSHDSNGFFQYNYAVTLPAPFVAHNGVRSWISIQPTTVFPAQPQWYWRAAEGAGNGHSAFSGSRGPRTFERIPFDLAFKLTGTTSPTPPPPPHSVPEPSTLLLLGSALTVWWRYRPRA